MITQDKQILNLIRICQISDGERQGLAERFPNLSEDQKRRLRDNLLEQLIVDAAREVVKKAETEGIANDESKFPDLYGQILNLAAAKEKESLEETSQPAV